MQVKHKTEFLMLFFACLNNKKKKKGKKQESKLDVHEIVRQHKMHMFNG